MSERDAYTSFFFSSSSSSSSFLNFLIFQVSTMLERDCSNQTARLASKIRQKLPRVILQNISLY